jgi:hypothetical protein
MEFNKTKYGQIGEIFHKRGSSNAYSMFLAPEQQTSVNY